MKSMQETNVTLGDIYYSSWGYEQTNVTFYQVVRLTNKSVWLEPIAKKTVEQLSSMSEKVLPVPNQFIKEPLIRTKDGRLCKRLKGGDVSTFYSEDSWATLYCFTGNPVYQSSCY